MSKLRQQHGFTLIELAVVLLIIGLLVGSIIAGKHLMRSAQLRSVISEYSEYTKAFRQYQDKYLALPGESGNDGRIGALPDQSYGTNYDTMSDEMFYAWQALQDAKLINVTKKWIAMVSTPYGGVPISKLDGASWMISYFSHPTTDNALWGDTYNHVLWFGGLNVNSPNGEAPPVNKPVMSAAEAYGIDSKLDDGKPGLGKVRAWRTGNLSPAPQCTTSDTAQSDAVYYEALDEHNCSLIFITGF